MIPELEAVSAVRTLIMRNPYLVPEISENDRTPVWDGSVFVYSDDKYPHPKKNLLGRVPIQVKGVKKEAFTSDRITYRVDRADLFAFDTEGGAIFIVVLINKDFQNQIYYKSLLPLDIARIKKQIGKKKSINLSFNKIPYDINDLANLFLNFIKDKNKQTGTVEPNRLFFKDWDNKFDTLGKLVISYSTVNPNDASLLENLTTNPFYIYLQPNGYNIQIPIDRAEKAIFTTQNKYEISSVNNISYMDSKTVWEEGICKIYFGSSLVLCISRDKENLRFIVSLNCNLCGSLKNRIKDADFFISVNKTSCILINGKTLKIQPLFDTEFEKFNDYLNMLKKLRDALEEIHVGIDLNMDEIIYDDFWKIQIIININKTSTYKLIKDESPVQHLKVANLDLLIAFIENDRNMSILDFFSNEYILIATDSEGHEHRVSQFINLKYSELICSNLNIEYVFDDIIRYDVWPEYISSVNLFLLETLKAFDLEMGKHEDLYILAQKLSTWLYSSSEIVEYKLNYYQTKIRRQPLSELEKQDCEKIVSASSSNWAIIAGSLILLERFEEANVLIEKQSVEDIQLFKSFPIYSLISKSVENEF